MKYKGEKLTVAMIYNRSKDHEISDTNVVYNGEGKELFIQYLFSEHYRLRTGFNQLTDFDNDLDGDGLVWL